MTNAVRRVRIRGWYPSDSPKESPKVLPFGLRTAYLPAAVYSEGVKTFLCDSLVITEQRVFTGGIFKPVFLRMVFAVDGPRLPFGIRETEVAKLQMLQALDQSVATEDWL